MIGGVLESRGSIGGQMGAGPHPGYLSSLYMTAITMCSLLDVAEAEFEEGHPEHIEAMAPLLAKLHERWMREDVEMFPSHYGNSDRSRWGKNGEGMWAVLSGRIYTQCARFGDPANIVPAGLARLRDSDTDRPEVWATKGRPGDNFVYPLYHDALLAGARIDGNGVELRPIDDPSGWPAEQDVQTPWGQLTWMTTISGDRVHCRFDAAAEVPVTIHYAGATVRTTSRGEATLHLAPARQAG